MKHARQYTLGKLRPLLVELRKRSALREKCVGVFYLKSKAFLHFHNDLAGIFADVKLDLTTYSRCRVATEKEQKVLLRSVDKCLSSMESGSARIRNGVSSNKSQIRDHAECAWPLRSVIQPVEEIPDATE
jgi:hypothetical protein